MIKKICFILIGITILVRFLGVFEPLAGSFSTKQITAAMTAKNFAETKHDPRYPRTDWTVNGEKGYELTDFPFYYYAIGIIAHTFHLPLDAAGRFSSLLCFSGILFLLFFIVRRWYGDEVALYAITSFSLFPSTIIFGQSFQNDMFSIFLLLAGIWALIKSQEDGKWLFLFFSSLCFGLAIAHRPFLFPFYLPCLFLFLGNGKRKVVFILQNKKFWIWSFALAIIPLAWFHHTYYSGLEMIQQAGTSSSIQISIRKFPDPLIWTVDFYKGILDQLTGMVFSPLGFTFALIGILWVSVKSIPDMFVLTSLILALFPLLIVPSKFYDLPYYFLPAAIPAAILSAKAIIGISGFLKQKLSGASAIIKSVLICLVVLLISFRYALPTVFAEHRERIKIVNAGRLADKTLPKEAKILAAHGSGGDLLYYSKRPGTSFLVDVEGKRLSDDKTRRSEIPRDEELAELFERIRQREKVEYFVIYDVSAFQRLSHFSKYIQGKYSCVLNDPSLLIYRLDKPKS